MTRDWTFTLTNANQWYNLWADLISKDTSFQDASFGNAPYIPNMCCEIKFQSTTTGVNISKSDSKEQSGFKLSGLSWDVDRSTSNNLNLNNYNFMSDTASGTLYVKITAN